MRKVVVLVSKIEIRPRRSSLSRGGRSTWSVTKRGGDAFSKADRVNACAASLAAFQAIGNTSELFRRGYGVGWGLAVGRERGLGGGIDWCGTWMPPAIFTPSSLQSPGPCHRPSRPPVSLPPRSTLPFIFSLPLPAPRLYHTSLFGPAQHGSARLESSDDHQAKARPQQNANPSDSPILVLFGPAQYGSARLESSDDHQAKARPQQNADSFCLALLGMAPPGLQARTITTPEHDHHKTSTLPTHKS